jgi:anti-sigma factor RsiW
MSHLDEGQLHELLDGELDEPARAAALAHLTGCERCKAAYDEAASFLAEADRLIDAVQVPAMAGAAPLVVESQKSEVEPAAPAFDFRLSTEEKRRRRLTTYRTLAWAASIVVAVGIGWVGSGMSKRAAPVTESARDEIAVAPAATPLAESVPAEAAQLTESRAKQAPESKARAATGASTADRRDLAGSAPAANQAYALRDSGVAADHAASEEVSAQSAVAPTAAAPAREAVKPAAPPTPAPLAARRQLAAERARSEPDAAALGAVASADIAVRGMITPTAFQIVGMEEAVRILGGSIRLIDGMSPTRFMTGRGRGSTLVRVVYEDPPGRELWLDQARVDGEDKEGVRSATTLLPGDTLLVVKESGTRSLGWVDQHGFQLRLTGFLSGDSLQAIQARVR